MYDMRITHTLRRWGCGADCSPKTEKALLAGNDSLELQREGGEHIHIETKCKSRCCCRLESAQRSQTTAFDPLGYFPKGCSLP